MAMLENGLVIGAMGGYPPKQWAVCNGCSEPIYVGELIVEFEDNYFHDDWECLAAYMYRHGTRAVAGEEGGERL